MSSPKSLCSIESKMSLTPEQHGGFGDVDGVGLVGESGRGLLEFGVELTLLLLLRSDLSLFMVLQNLLWCALNILRDDPG